MIECMQFVRALTSWNFQLLAPRIRNLYLVVCLHIVKLHNSICRSPRHNGIFNCRPPEIRNLFWWCLHIVMLHNSICRSPDIMEFSIVGPPKSGTFFWWCLHEAMLHNSICRSLDIMEFSMVGPPKSRTFFWWCIMRFNLLVSEPIWNFWIAAPGNYIGTFFDYIYFMHARMQFVRALTSCMEFSIVGPPQVWEALPEIHVSPDNI